MSRIDAAYCYTCCTFRGMCAYLPACLSVCVLITLLCPAKRPGCCLGGEGPDWNGSKELLLDEGARATWRVWLYDPYEVAMQPYVKSRWPLVVVIGTVIIVITMCSVRESTGINSRLPSVNHTLISPILPHPVVWVALPPSVPSTHHSHHPSPLHSFTPGLKLSFSANPSHHSLPFLLMD